MFTILNSREIIEQINACKNGTMARICYKTEVPLKAEFKKQGYRIIKIVETTCRFGVKYSNIHSVAERLAEKQDTISTRTNPYTWIVENKIKKHNEKNEYYVQFATVNNHSNTNVRFIMIHNDEVMYFDDIDSNEMPVNSYFNKSNGNEIRTIKFENIIRINNIGTRMFER